VLSETVRRDKEDRLKAIVTTEGVYFVRARGTPSPEAIVLLVRFSELYECQPLPSGKCMSEWVGLICLGVGLEPMVFGLKPWFCFKSGHFGDCFAYKHGLKT